MSFIYSVNAKRENVKKYLLIMFCDLGLTSALSDVSQKRCVALNE